MASRALMNKIAVTFFLVPCNMVTLLVWTTWQICLTFRDMAMKACRSSLKKWNRINNGFIKSKIRKSRKRNRMLLRKSYQDLQMIALTLQETFKKRMKRKTMKRKRMIRKTIKTLQQKTIKTFLQKTTKIMRRTTKKTMRRKKIKKMRRKTKKRNLSAAIRNCTKPCRN